MRVDAGVAMLVYRETVENQREYLILRRCKNWDGWELPKGHLEHDSHEATVFVELNEEAGIEPVDVKKLASLDKYLTFQFEENQETVVSNFKCFEVEVNVETEVDLSKNPFDEHSDYKWVSQNEAKDELEHEEQRNLL